MTDLSEIISLCSSFVFSPRPFLPNIWCCSLPLGRKILRLPCLISRSCAIEMSRMAKRANCFRPLLLCCSIKRCIAVRYVRLLRKFALEYVSSATSIRSKQTVVSYDNSASIGTFDLCA